MLPIIASAPIPAGLPTTGASVLLSLLDGKLVHVLLGEGLSRTGALGGWRAEVVRASAGQAEELVVAEAGCAVAVEGMARFGGFVGGGVGGRGLVLLDGMRVDAGYGVGAVVSGFEVE